MYWLQSAEPILTQIPFEMFLRMMVVSTGKEKKLTCVFPNLSLPFPWRFVLIDRSSTHRSFACTHCLSVRLLMHFVICPIYSSMSLVTNKMFRGLMRHLTNNVLCTHYLYTFIYPLDCVMHHHIHISFTLSFIRKFPNAYLQF